MNHQTDLRPIMPQMTGDTDKLDRFFKQFKQRCPQSYQDIVSLKSDQQALAITWRELPSRFATGIAEQVWNGKVSHSVIDLNQFVSEAAAATILRVMQEGQSKHGDTWQARNDKEDLQHALAHLNQLSKGDGSDSHLEHALTRVAIILARKQLNQAGGQRHGK